MNESYFVNFMVEHAWKKYGKALEWNTEEVGWDKREEKANLADIRRWLILLKYFHVTQKRIKKLESEKKGFVSTNNSAHNRKKALRALQDFRRDLIIHCRELSFRFRISSENNFVMNK